MGVLLLVAREVTCVSPHQVQQPEGNVGRTVSRVELRAWEEVEMREVVGGEGVKRSGWLAFYRRCYKENYI